MVITSVVYLPRWPHYLIALALASLGCEEAPRPEPRVESAERSSQGSESPKAKAGRAQRAPLPWPGKQPVLRTPSELEGDLARACQEARKAGQLVLLEFSAPWCKDCVRLQAMKREPVLEQALLRYRELDVNVGDFDQHPSLLAAFNVRAIAHWELLAPTDCSAPPWLWRRLGHRTLEPETGKARVSAQDLVHWLEARSAT